MSGRSLYAYVGNDPINKIDPSGLADLWSPGCYTGDFCEMTGDVYTGGGNSGGVILLPDGGGGVLFLVGGGGGGSSNTGPVGEGQGAQIDWCKIAAEGLGDEAAPAQKEGWNLGADYASLWSASGQYASEYPGNATAADRGFAGNVGRFFSWASRAGNLLSIYEQPDQLTKSFAAADAVVGEALSGIFGPAGTLASVAYSKAGGTRALNSAMAPSANAEIAAG